MSEIPKHTCFLFLAKKFLKIHKTQNYRTMLNCSMFNVKQARIVTSNKKTTTKALKMQYKINKNNSKHFSNFNIRGKKIMSNEKYQI